MTISDLEFYLVEMPRAEGQNAIRVVLTRLITASGGEGWGEATLRWRPGELAGRRDALLPSLVGRNACDISELLTLDALSHPGLRSAVEMACWDIVGRACRQPLCNLWGGLFRHRIPLAVRLAASDPETAGRHARELLERGFHSHIVASCGDPARDLETLDCVREAVGFSTELRFDGDGHYAAAAARELAGDLEHDGLRYFLDPVAGGEFEQTAALRRQVNVPLALSTGIGSPADLLAVARAGAADYVKIDVQRVGGLNTAKACAVVAEAAGLGLVLGGQPTLGVATAAGLHLAAAIPAFSNGNESVYPQLLDDVLCEPLELAESMLTVPGGPGLGIEVDRAKLERFQVQG
jgi:L-alanine-DL-glutamate epimerase-like enolase superfamily enzyme